MSLSPKSQQNAVQGCILNRERKLIYITEYIFLSTVGT